MVSDVASALNSQPEALANYYDLLASDAFGNYRTLLQDVTLSPVMGNYLNMLRNTAANPAKGTSADENYAREIMQLFTIGLNQLNPDGTLKLDSTGLPIPTYDQADHRADRQCAHRLVLSLHATNPSFTGGAADWYNPMQLFPANHDNTQKTIVGGTIIPPNQGGATDLKILLDTLFNHPNAAPFFARGLIQRLVTSNPSPGYVYRVASVFANDGSGTRGNLAAVVKAVLTDYEARSPAMLTNASFGKLKEPLLRQTALYRAFNGRSSSGRWSISALFTPDTSIGRGRAALSHRVQFLFAGLRPAGPAGPSRTLRPGIPDHYRRHRHHGAELPLQLHLHRDGTGGRAAGARFERADRFGHRPDHQPGRTRSTCVTCAGGNNVAPARNRRSSPRSTACLPEPPPSGQSAVRFVSRRNHLFRGDPTIAPASTFCPMLCP